MPYKDKKKRLAYGLGYYKKNKKLLLEYKKDCYQKYRKRIIAKATKYQRTEKGKLVNCTAVKKYRQSEKGKIVRKKMSAKRRHNLGWIQMFENPFDESELIDWHHINDAYVIAIPRDLHQLYSGKFHREKTMEIVKQIYMSGE